MTRSQQAGDTAEGRLSDCEGRHSEFCGAGEGRFHRLPEDRNGDFIAPAGCLIVGLEGIDIRKSGGLQQVGDICGIRLAKISGQEETTGFAVTNVSLKATKAIKITESFSLPIFGQVTANPCSQKAYLVFGFTLQP